MGRPDCTWTCRSWTPSTANLWTCCAQTEQTPIGELLALWQDVITHTEEHFGLEDRWMLAAGFAPENCHMHQHEAVLDVLREGARAPRRATLPLLRSIVPELASWFINHAKTMDAALVYHLQSTGFDIHAPLPAAAATGTAGHHASGSAPVAALAAARRQRPRLPRSKPYARTVDPLVRQRWLCL